MERNTRNSFQGVVVSDKMDKSIVVSVESYKKHSKYEKRVKSGKKYVAHDETNSAHVGDLVTIRTCRPLSKTKHFILVSIDKLAPTPIKKAVEDINEEIDVDVKEKEVAVEVLEATKAELVAEIEELVEELEIVTAIEDEVKATPTKKAAAPKTETAAKKSAVKKPAVKKEAK